MALTAEPKPEEQRGRRKDLLERKQKGLEFHLPWLGDRLLEVGTP